MFFPKNDGIDQLPMLKNGTNACASVNTKMYNVPIITVVLTIFVFSNPMNSIIIVKIIVIIIIPSEINTVAGKPLAGIVIGNILAQTIIS